MKKIINGKVYDTETAAVMGEWSNGAEGRFEYCAEDLYRKRTGEFFLHGQGGPMSKYVRHSGNNSWGGSEELIPLSYSAAQSWAEDHLDGDTYESIFGKITEDTSRVSVSISISAANAEKLKRMAAERGLSVSALIDHLIEGAMS